MKPNVRQKLEATLEKVEEGQRILRGKLARWCFRWALTAAAAAYLLPRHPGWIWILYVIVPIGILNLLFLLRIYLQLRALRALTVLSLEPGADR
jgi:hypothetical protein